jgi:hypothetical protein
MYSDEGEHFRFHQAQKAGRTARYWQYLYWLRQLEVA